MLQRTFRSLLLLLISLLLAPLPARAGGWVPRPGHGYVSLGYSRKTATSSWDAAGAAFDNRVARPGDPPDLRARSGDLHVHDFHYLLLSGEAGALPHLSFTYLFTFLHGIEGAEGHQDIGIGLSDAWLGAKLGVNDWLRLPAWPIAVAFVARVPWLYGQEGEYSRYIFKCAQDAMGTPQNCTRVGQSSSWLGLLKYDLTAMLLFSRSLPRGLGWANLELAYVARLGAPADQVTFQADLGVRLPIPRANLHVKGALFGAFSVGNETAPEPDDRFSMAVGSVYNFNAASMLKLNVGLLAMPWRGLLVELGYGRWLWGQSARRYDEIFAAVGWNF